MSGGNRDGSTKERGIRNSVKSCGNLEYQQSDYIHRTHSQYTAASIL